MQGSLILSPFCLCCIIYIIRLSLFCTELQLLYRSQLVNHNCLFLISILKYKDHARCKLLRTRTQYNDGQMLVLQFLLLLIQYYIVQRNCIDRTKIDFQFSVELSFCFEVVTLILKKMFLTKCINVWLYVRSHLQPPNLFWRSLQQTQLAYFGSTHKHYMLFKNITKINPYFVQTAHKNLIIIKKNIFCYSWFQNRP